MGRYDHKKIEKKWQALWEETGAFRAIDDAANPKDYLLVEFPYPSGEGLHVGHVRSWTALDIVARKHRAQGKNVLYPMGWDAFGLPTENYAIKTGKDPRIVTKENTDTFRRQIKSIGLSFDWSREINTTDPSYYRWTQWIFLQLYKHGLAYKASTLINWCPKDKIGLANEEVVNGACERCGTLVEKRQKEQWMLAITKYAQRLYDDLDTVSYIEQAKIQQRNWIGPSKGAYIDFPLTSSSPIRVFTTRADTLWGSTYLALAPEHPALQSLLSIISNKSEVEAYQKQALGQLERTRSAEGKEKTGVLLVGVSAVNPLSKKEIPVFVADYVLPQYGTGAVMGVPGHDSRDYAFAKAFNLPIIEVIEPLIVREHGEDGVRTDVPFVEREAVVAVIKHWSEDTYLAVRWKRTNWQGFIIGGINQGEDASSAGLREITEESGYSNPEALRPIGGTIHTQFYQNVKQENRFAHFHPVLFQLKDEQKIATNEEEQLLHEFLWLTPKEMEKFITHPDMRLVWQRLMGDECYSGEGIVTNSGPYSGMTSEEARKAIIKAVGGEEVTTFKLRDWVFSRQRYWGEPIPMVHCQKCGWVPIPESDLPVVLPDIGRYKPTDTGESPLAALDAWVNTTCPKCDGPAKRETDVMPNWAGSSWYYLRYCDPHNDATFASKEKLTYWTPVDWYNGGMEHTTLHLLYSRFWHKFLFDLQLVPTSEPYTKRTSHGLILAEGGEKMSKSVGNVVNPDDIVEHYGADTLRIYEMFLGPFDQAVAWQEASIMGARRFLERIWHVSESVSSTASVLLETQRIMQQTIAKISADIEGLKFNTAVSQLMILLNHFESLSELPKDTFKVFLQLLAPFAPHLGHELWEQLGETSYIGKVTWPEVGEALPEVGEVVLALQVNGKLRGTMKAQKTAQQEAVLAQAREVLAKWLPEGKEGKVIYIPGKIVNFVV